MGLDRPDTFFIIYQTNKLPILYVGLRRMPIKVNMAVVSILVLSVALLTSAKPGAALELAGPSQVIDGDTLEIGSRRIRLHGIDAPESAQRCQLPKGTWDCGSEAEAVLLRLTADQLVRCQGSSFDQYGRLIAVCSTETEPNINAKLVADGLAWAFTKYSNDYKNEEAKARGLKIGIWQAKTQPPWVYRQRRWETASQLAPNRCPIKGNINQAGEHIYHTPWSRHYTRTKINLAVGERWFCDENEAIAAGWRPPIR